MEKEQVFTSAIKNKGVFDFPDFYLFCYEWLTNELGLKITEKKYKEKISGDSKDIEIEWLGEKDMTDYFRFGTRITFRILGLKKIEVNQGGKKVKTNEGDIEMKMNSDIVRDYKGKFESSAFSKFMRTIYEKWVIPARIEEYEEKIMNQSDGFLSQAKSYLDLEGKK